MGSKHSLASLFALFCPTCRRTVDYARRSFAMSLAGSSAALAAAGMGNWTDGAGGDAWNGTLRRPDAVEMSKTSESGPNTDGVGAGGSSGAGTEDVPAESLADDDSRFLDIMGIKVRVVAAVGVSQSMGATTHSVGQHDCVTCQLLVPRNDVSALAVL